VQGSGGAWERRSWGARVIRIQSYEELDVYKLAFEAAMRIIIGKLVNMINNPSPWVLKRGDQ
jgi:hypothetical protein